MRELLKFMFLVFTHAPCPLCEVNPAGCAECEVCAGEGIVPATYQGEF